MRQRLIALIIVVAVAAGLVAVAAGAGGRSRGNSAGSLRKLPMGAAGGGGGRPAAMATVDGAVGVASMPTRAMGEVEVSGSLPALGGSATAYGFDDEISSSAVTRLASALGLHGDVTREGDDFLAVGSSGVLQVAVAGAAPWSYQPGCSPAEGGGIECTASAGSGGVAVACAVSSCGGDSPCPPPAPCDVKPPPRPAGLPSRDEAAKVALDLLTRAGIATAGVDPEVEDGWSQWTVEVPTVMDGHPVDGMTTTVGIGPGSTVTSAAGFLGRPAALGDYPLAGTAVGLDRLREGRWLSVGGVAMLAAGRSGVAHGVAPAPPVGGMSMTGSAPAPRGVAEPTPGGSSTEPVPPSKPEPSPPDPVCDSCSADPPEPVAPPPVVVTGVRLVLALVAGDDGMFTVVPAYAFETRDGGTLPLVPAVVDDLLEQPATNPVPAPKPAPPLKTS